jgi:hypothetical protein
MQTPEHHKSLERSFNYITAQISLKVSPHHEFEMKTMPNLRWDRCKIAPGISDSRHIGRFHLFVF